MNHTDMNKEIPQKFDEEQGIYSFQVILTKTISYYILTFGWRSSAGIAYVKQSKQRQSVMGQTELVHLLRGCSVHPFHGTLPEYERHLDASNQKRTDPLQLRGILQNKCLVNFESIKAIKVKKRWRNCPRLKNTKETWQINATHNSNWTLLPVKK